jgi:uncharacterized membrane protein YozB (DUF420 family)
MGALATDEITKKVLTALFRGRTAMHQRHKSFPVWRASVWLTESVVKLKGNRQR